MNNPDISCIICTRNRADSLRLTLEYLARADRSGLECEVVVVDNGSQDETLATALAFQDRLSLRVLVESEVGDYGKGKCLNRAIAEGGLGAVIAILDDDMSPREDWFQGIAAICRRHPEHSLFSGRSYIEWPMQEPPKWAKSPRIESWAYSVMDWGPEDRPLPAGRWFSGNHFWFRKRVLAQANSFRDHWTSEAKFQLDAVAAGFRGMYAPDAVAGHRVQHALLDPHQLAERAKLVGRIFAEMRLSPPAPRGRVVDSFRKHPLLTRCYCLAGIVKWSTLRGCLGLPFTLGRLVDRYLDAVEHAKYLHSLLSVAARFPEYRVWGRKAEQAT